MAAKPYILAYENNYKIAHALEAPGYTIRPFNRYNPDHSEWWLIPSTEWPAYRFGKYCVKLHIEDEQPLIGYYVEHGLPLELQTLPGIDQKFIMRPNWYWHEFIKEMQNDSLVYPIQQTLESTGLPLVCRLEIYPFNQVPDYDNPEESFRPEVVEYNFKADGRNLELVQSSQLNSPPVKDSQTVAELGRKLASLAELKFFWIDFYIGVRLAYGTQETGTWKFIDVREKVLKPWEAFVK